MILPEISRQIEDLYIDEAMCQRVISIEMEPINDGILIVAWQCNMASIEKCRFEITHCNSNYSGSLCNGNEC